MIVLDKLNNAEVPEKENCSKYKVVLRGQTNIFS